MHRCGQSTAAAGRCMKTVGPEGGWWCGTDGHLPQPRGSANDMKSAARQAASAAAHDAQGETDNITVEQTAPTDEQTRQRFPPDRREHRQDTRCDRGRHRENQHDPHDGLSSRHQNAPRPPCRVQTRPQPITVECPLRKHPQRHPTSSKQARRPVRRSARCIHISDLPQMRLSSSPRKPIKLLLRNLRDRRPRRPSRSTQRERPDMANRHR